MLYILRQKKSHSSQFQLVLVSADEQYTFFTIPMHSASSYLLEYLPLLEESEMITCCFIAIEDFYCHLKGIEIKHPFSVTACLCDDNHIHV